MRLRSSLVIELPIGLFSSRLIAESPGDSVPCVPKLSTRLGEIGLTANV